MRISSLSLTLPLCFLLAAACGNSGGADDNPGDDDDTVDAAPPSFMFDAMCTQIAADVAACATVDHATCVTVFQRGADRGCSGWLDDLQTWVLDHHPAYQCMNVPGLGVVPAISGAAPEDAQIGDACTGAVAKDACYSIACDGSLDCPSGWGCNDATGHCFDNGATCAGMPCHGSLDCPSGETCNGAQGVCIRN
jgi:hypothetical protein